MSNEPLVSVIVPAYNSAKYIAETMVSLLGQDYHNIEIIVVNDGSEDDTLELLKTYGDKIIIIDQNNAGVSDARNNGIRAARGEFISFCDSDDLWSPEKVREQVNFFKNHPDVGMVFCDWHVWNPVEADKFVVPEDFKLPKNGQEIDPAESGWIYHKLLLDCICLTSTVMLRRSIVNEIGYFDTSLWRGEDYDYWLRASRITEIHKLRSKLVLYRYLPQSITRIPTRVNYGYKVLHSAIKRWGTACPNGDQNNAKAVKERLAHICFNFGYLHLKSGDTMIAISSFWGSVIQKPFWYLPWMYLILGLWKQLSKTKAHL